MANVDKNNRTVGFGTDSSNDKQQLMIDNSTGYLIVSGLADGNPSLSNPTVDANNRKVSSSVDSNGDIYSLKINTDRRLYIKTA